MAGVLSAFEEYALIMERASRLKAVFGGRPDRRNC